MSQFEYIRKKKSVKLKTKKECDRQKCYNSVIWRNISANHKKTHPLCELCQVENKLQVADLVHHIQKFNDLPNDILQWTLLSDTDNLLSICNACHHAIHMSPEELTDKQKLYLKDRKEKLFNKYLLEGTHILLTDDLNIPKKEDK